MPEPGQLIDRYVVEAVLGEGGMGRVYRVLDPRLGRRVALKVLLARGEGEVERAIAAARMVREARSAAGFNHPNVVAIYDVGEVDGSPFIAMELVEGAPLRAYVHDADVTSEQRLHWLLDVARGLDAAHRTGLVHRDIKPDNVMITPDGAVKILDFGIARRTQNEAVGNGTPTTLVSLTSEGQTLGTPQYMSPEQLQGDPLDGGTDQFAWGVMAWELITGALPWGQTTNGAHLVAAVLAMQVPPLDTIAPTVDPRLSDVVARALAKNRADRFATMADVVAALGAGPMSGVPSSRGAPSPSSRSVAFKPTERAVPTPPLPSRPPLSAAASGSGREEPLLTTSAPFATQPLHATTPDLNGQRRWWRRLGPIAGACALVTGGVAIVLATNAPRVIVCADLGATEAGLFDSSRGPRCTRALVRDAIATHWHATRVTTRGGRVQTLEHLTFAGTRVTADDTKTEITYGGDGSVREVISRDPKGNITEWQKWSDGGKRVDFVDDDGTTPRHDLSSRATGVLLDYDGHGLVVRERYVGPTGRPRLVPRDGAYGVAYSAWDRDHWNRLTYLAADSLPHVSTLFGAVEDRAAINEPVITRDAHYLDVDGRPMADYAGVFHEHHEGDTPAAEGSGTLFFFGAREQHVVHGSQGAAGYRWRWDPLKRVREVNIVDGNGRPEPSRHDTWFTVVQTYDLRGRRVLLEHLDENRNRVPSRGDNSSTFEAAEHGVWNDADDLVELTELDATGALIENGEGFARRVLAFNERGQPIEARYYDASGNIAPRHDGGAIWRTTYDERGLVISEASFDAENRPVASVHGYAVTRNKYDRLRNLVEVARFGADGRPCVDDRGVSVERSRYDENDDLVEVSYFDADGAPAMLGGEYATRRVRNDARGLVVEEEYLDGHGSRAIRKDGYAAVRYVRDRNDDVVEESYFGQHDEPKVVPGGYAKKKTTYDGHRKPIEISLFGATGAPRAGIDGWAIERSTFDETGLIVRRDHFDPDGRPVLTKSGAASTTLTYDERGNLIEEMALGLDGKPIVTSDGYAAKKSAYNERDELVGESLFSATGGSATGAAGWSSRQLRYDDLGLLVEEAFFDEQHHPVSPKGLTYASTRNRYDARQRLIEDGYFDADGVPTKGPDGAEKLHYTRDAYGRATEVAYLDGANAPMASKEGKFVVRTRYDDAGRPLEEQFLDGAGAPHVANDGCAGHRTKYDLVGRKLEEVCLDGKSAPVLNQEGWAIRRTIYDARGNAVDVANYGPDGTLRADKEGVARRRSHFDERSLLRDTTFFDAADRPTQDKRGRGRIEVNYDDNGHATREE